MAVVVTSALVTIVTRIACDLQKFRGPGSVVHNPSATLLLNQTLAASVTYALDLKKMVSCIPSQLMLVHRPKKKQTTVGGRPLLRDRQSNFQVCRRRR